jgi:hypothetical protein
MYCLVSKLEEEEGQQHSRAPLGAAVLVRRGGWEGLSLSLMDYWSPFVRAASYPASAERDARRRRRRLASDRSSWWLKTNATRIAGAQKSGRTTRLRRQPSRQEAIAIADPTSSGKRCFRVSAIDDGSSVAYWPALRLAVRVASCRSLCSLYRAFSLPLSIRRTTAERTKRKQSWRGKLLCFKFGRHRLNHTNAHSAATNRRSQGFFFSSHAPRCARMELTSRFSALKTPRRVIYGSMRVWSSHDDPILFPVPPTMARISLLQVRLVIRPTMKILLSLSQHKEIDERRSPDNKQGTRSCCVVVAPIGRLNLVVVGRKKVDTTDVWLSVYNWNRCCSTAMNR